MAGQAAKQLQQEQDQKLFFRVFWVIEGFWVWWVTQPPRASLQCPARGSQPLILIPPSPGPLPSPRPFLPSFLPKVLQWLCYHGWFFQCWHPFVFSSSHLALIKTHLVSGHSQTDEGQPQMSPGLSPELSRPVFPTTLYAFTLWFHGHCNLSAIKI